MSDRPKRRTRNDHDTIGKHFEEEQERIDRSGDKVDIASDDSFPASDPPSFTPIKGEKKNDTNK